MIKSGSKIFRKLYPHAFHRCSRKFISQWNVTIIGQARHKFETRLRLERRMLSRNNLLECPIFIFLFVRSTLLVIAYDSCIRTIDRQSDVISIALHRWDSFSVSKFLVQGCFWTMTHVDTRSSLVFFSRLRNTYTEKKKVSRVTWSELKRIYTSNGNISDFYRFYDTIPSVCHFQVSKRYISVRSWMKVLFDVI